jgi:hypothetical protein
MASLIYSRPILGFKFPISDSGIASDSAHDAH